MWAVLTESSKKGLKWDPQEFFLDGEAEISSVMENVKSLGLHPPRRKALDFGCGVGRLTQALVNYFDEVSGVDIAPSMIEQANRYNRHADRCKYYLNDKNNLTLFPNNSFDFIYTNITLQHIPPRYHKDYIQEFLRILSGGVLMFHLPSQPANTVRGLAIRVTPPFILRAYSRLRFGHYDKALEIHPTKRQAIVKLIEQNYGNVVDIMEEHWAGKNYVGVRYCITKASRPTVQAGQDGRGKL